jgi:cytosine/adenosine deaminase-related metal-dependent hydrolase
MDRSHFSLIIRNAYLRERDGVYDIGINSERIIEIATKITGTGELEIDSNGNLVSPGFVDAHTHMDKAFTSPGERFPKYWDRPYTRDAAIADGLAYYKNATKDDIKRHVMTHARMQLINGTLYTRTHVDLDSVVKTKAIEAVLEGKDELKDLLDIQVVAFAQCGFYIDLQSEPLISKSLELGCNLVGGVDPATRENTIEGSLDLCFKLATKYNVDIDYHIHDIGTVGFHTINRLAQKTLEHGYAGRVTVSHAFCFADAPPDWLDMAIPLFKESNLKFVTCFSSTPPGMPVTKLLEAGITLGCGSDNIRDFWVPFGNGNMLEGALIETQRLELKTNRQLDFIWRMITNEGAKILGIETDYGIDVGKKADLVVLNALSPQWAIIEQAKKLYVIKNGRVIAKDGVIVV